MVRNKAIHNAYLNIVEKLRLTTGTTIITPEQSVLQEGIWIDLSKLREARQEITDRRQEITDRWRRSGLLNGLNGGVNENLAQLFESPQRQYIGGDVSYPVARRVFSNLVANDIVQVQPLGRAVGNIFYMDTHIKTNLFRIPKIVGSTIELYMIDLINEWNKFIVNFDGLSFENKLRLDGLKYFTYLKDKLLQYHPNIYVEYCFTSYDYNVYEYVEKQTEYNFKEYLKVKPELKHTTTKDGLFYLFYSTPYPEIQLGGTLTGATAIDTLDQTEYYHRLRRLAGIREMPIPPESRRTT